MKKIAKVKIEWTPASEGGRRNIMPIGMRYCPIIVMEQTKTSDNTLWSAEVYNTDIENRTSFADLTFLSHEAPHYLLTHESRFDLYEGQTVVGRGVIVSTENEL